MDDQIAHDEGKERHARDRCVLARAGPEMHEGRGRQRQEQNDRGLRRQLPEHVFGGAHGIVDADGSRDLVQPKRGRRREVDTRPHGQARPDGNQSGGRHRGDSRPVDAPERARPLRRGERVPAGGGRRGNRGHRNHEVLHRKAKGREKGEVIAQERVDGRVAAEGAQEPQRPRQCPEPAPTARRVRHESEHRHRHQGHAEIDREEEGFAPGVQGLHPRNRVETLAREIVAEEVDRQRLEERQGTQRPEVAVLQLGPLRHTRRLRHREQLNRGDHQAQHQPRLDPRRPSDPLPRRKLHAEGRSEQRERRGERQRGEL